MSRFVITGGGGFVGANLVRSLLAEGDEIHLLTRPGSNFWRLEDIKEQCAVHVVDLTHSAAVEAMLQTINPDTVVHLAVAGTNQSARLDTSQVIATNVLGTINLANACAKHGCVFVNTGSSSEYGLKELPMRESDRLEPANLYGVTKAAGTMYVQSIARKHQLPMTTLRLFSPFGYFDEPHRLIPTLILSAINNSTLALCSPIARRDFIFIDDVIAAYLHFAKIASRLKGDVVNVGSGRSHSVAEVVAAAEAILGSPLVATYGAALARQSEPKEWVADISKAKALGWQPLISFEGGLRTTMDWSKRRLKGLRHLQR